MNILREIVVLSALSVSTTMAANVTQLHTTKTPIQTFLVTDNGQPVANAEVEVINSYGFVKGKKKTRNSGMVNFYTTSDVQLRVTMPNGEKLENRHIIVN